MTTRSAWRGEAGKGITPRRITSKRGEAKAAPISMAQQASPHWYTQREYLREMFSRAVRGLGDLPLSMRPISGPGWGCGSDPTQDLLAPGVEQAQGQHCDEDGHLDDAEGAVGLEAGGPREDEHGFDVEHHEEEGEDVVPDLR